MTLTQVRRDDALSKAEFHQRLKSWLAGSDDDIVGPRDIPGVTAWIHVCDNERLFALHADATRKAVKEYLDLVSTCGDNLQWEVTTSRRGKLTALLYGPKKVRIKSFYLYAVDGNSH